MEKKNLLNRKRFTYMQGVGRGKGEGTVVSRYNGKKTLLNRKKITYALPNDFSGVFKLIIE